MASLSQLVALVLAAGSSRRFGSDKRLARLSDGRTLLAASFENAHNVFFDVRVVLRLEDEPSHLGLPTDGKVVRSTRSGEGMAHSLAAGVSAVLDSNALAIAVLLGDMPRIDSATLRALARLSTADNIVVPSQNGKRGHPVIFGRNFWPELLALQGDTGARDLLLRHPHHVIEVAVPDAGIHLDIDHPDRLEQ